MPQHGFQMTRNTILLKYTESLCPLLYDEGSSGMTKLAIYTRLSVKLFWNNTVESGVRLMSVLENRR